jgi:hypothetical protein
MCASSVSSIVVSAAVSVGFPTLHPVRSEFVSHNLGGCAENWDLRYFSLLYCTKIGREGRKGSRLSRCRECLYFVLQNGAVPWFAVVLL